MIKVIKNGIARRIVCENCNSILEFDKFDIVIAPKEYNVTKGFSAYDNIKSIVCPVCKQYTNLQCECVD